MKPNPKLTFDQDMDNDPVWDLVDIAGSPPTVSPTFLQDTLRRTRLESQAPAAWWKSLFSLPALGVTTAAVCAAVIVLVSLNKSESEAIPTAHVAAAPELQDIELEDALATELLAAASDNPELMSDGDLLALLF